MAVGHYALTLSGSAQALSSINGAPDRPIRTVTIQPDPSNANPVYVGASGVTSTAYGIRLPAPSGGVPPAPLMLGDTQGVYGHFRLSDIYVTGTAAEVIRLLVVTL